MSTSKLFATFVILLLLVIMLMFTSITWQTSQSRRKECPKESYVVSVRTTGRLTDQIWEYMSLIEFVHLHEDELKMYIYVPDVLQAEMDLIFERATNLDKLQVSQYCMIRDPYVLTNKETHMNISNFLNSNKQSITLDMYSARYWEVLQYGIANIRKILRFKTELIDLSYNRFNLIKTMFGPPDVDVTFVGMHYSSIDNIPLFNRLYKTYNDVTDYTYYQIAMNYFKTRYKHVVFILITIDYKWLHENLSFLQEGNNLIVNPNGKYIVKDFALLSHCNHSIINYGTFGVTSALFAQGTTFVYDLGIPLDHEGTTIAMGIAEMLPNWHVLKPNGTRVKHNKPYRVVEGTTIAG